MEPIVSFVDVTRRWGAKLVLDRVSFSVAAGERIGVVGPNGAGKTTLLRTLVGDELPDDGSVARARSLEIGYVPQVPVFDPEATVEQVVASGQGTVRALIAKADDLRHLLATADAVAAKKRARELADVEAQIERLDGWDPDRAVRRAIMDMGLDGLETRTLGSLSGGEARRVALARALVSNAGLLVLDEPTNHLDLDTVLVLEERLRESKGTVVFVTHDRAFLDSVATRLLEVDRGALYSFEGTYADWLERKAVRADHEASDERSRQNLLRRELAWLKRGTRAQRTKNKDHVARVHALAAERPKAQDGQVEFGIPTGPRLGSTILELKNVSKSLGGRVLVKNLSLRLEKGDRIGIVGKNGVGKTTLVRILTGEEKPDSGEVIVGPNTKFVHARQQKDDLDPDLTVHASVGGEGDWIVVGDERITVRAYLRRFLFTSEALEQKVGRLSGGERSRVQLARMLRDGGNFVILDEPTNDLDLQTLRVLEDALESFPGVAVIVSHDRAFLGQVATRILGFEGDGQVEVSDGGLDLYLERRARRREEAKAAEALAAARARKPATTASAGTAGPKKLTWKEQRELETLEAKIPTVEAEVAELTKRLEDPALYAKAQEARAVGDSLKAKQDEVAGLYARWEELEARRGD